MDLLIAVVVVFHWLQDCSLPSALSSTSSMGVVAHYKTNGSSCLCSILLSPLLGTLHKTIKQILGKGDRKLKRNSSFLTVIPASSSAVNTAPSTSCLEKTPRIGNLMERGSFSNYLINAEVVARSTASIHNTCVDQTVTNKNRSVF